MLANMGSLAAALLLVAAACAQAKTHCADGWVCVESAERPDGVTLIARNLKPWPVTLTFRTRTENLRASSRSPATVTLAGRESRVLGDYEKRRDDRRYWYSYRYDWTVGEYDPDHDDNYRYALPYQPGQSYRVLQGFGSRFSHSGRERYAVDFKMPVGTAVHAARGGVVTRVVEEHDRGCWQDGCGQYANFIVILHHDGTTGEYYHLMHQGALVNEGDRVTRGQHIGYSGNTGHTTMPHLHFAVYRADTWGRTQSLRFVFQSREGEVRSPRRGQRYTAP